jgi:hypothetical protein
MLLVAMHLMVTVGVVESLQGLVRYLGGRSDADSICELWRDVTRVQS